MSGAAPVAIDIPVEPREVLTPKPGPAPRINGPSLTGVTPGHDVLYKIPVTGTRPITYGVTNLPKGLTLDAATGIIRGTIAARGRYPVTFTAKNAAGSASKPFTFVAEGQLALTPAMGWNSWNAYGRAVSDSLARAAADAMVSKGLIDHGWTYVNLDDGWERSAARPIRCTKDRCARPTARCSRTRSFPDMKALGDYIHAKGLKFGIYSGPGPTTCQRLEASWQHELQDFRNVREVGRRLSQVRLVRLHERARAGRDEPAAAGAQAPVSSRARGAQPGAARHHLLALPVRMGQRLGMGRGEGNRRKFMAHDGRHHRHVGEHGGDRVPAGGELEVRVAGPLERPRHARDRKGGLGSAAP